MICGSDPYSCRLRGCSSTPKLIIRSVLALPWTTGVAMTISLTYDQPGREPSAQFAERRVGDARHRGEHHRRSQRVGADRESHRPSTVPRRPMRSASAARPPANGGNATRSTGSSIRRRTGTVPRRTRLDPAAAHLPPHADQRVASRPVRSRRATTAPPAAPRGSAPRAAPEAAHRINAPSTARRTSIGRGCKTAKSSSGRSRSSVSFTPGKRGRRPRPSRNVHLSPNWTARQRLRRRSASTAHELRVHLSPKSDPGRAATQEPPAGAHSGAPAMSERGERSTRAAAPDDPSGSSTDSHFGET